MLRLKDNWFYIWLIEWLANKFAQLRDENDKD